MSFLEVKNLTVTLKQQGTQIVALEKLNFTMEASSIVGLVGESGCGKSLFALALLRLLTPPLSITSGSILLDGVDLLTLSEAEMCQLRGRKIAMIFQDPMTSLNPVMKVGDQIGEVFYLKEGLKIREGRKRAIALMEKVRIPAASQRVHAYPFQLSGGMRQRIAIAMALAAQPSLLLADEPTTALDVSIQAQILELLRDLQQELRMSVLFISHEFSVLAAICQKIWVMYGSCFMEAASLQQLLEHPVHPYTRALLRSRPDVHHKRDRLHVIPGSVPALGGFPSGCRFRERCERSQADCALEIPLLAPFLPHAEQRHAVACRHPYLEEEPLS